MIWSLIVGLIAGWITGHLMRGEGYGIVIDIVLGLLGAIIGRWIFAALGIVVFGGLGYLIMSVIGAVVLVTIVHAIKG